MEGGPISTSVGVAGGGGGGGGGGGAADVITFLYALLFYTTKTHKKVKKYLIQNTLDETPHLDAAPHTNNPHPLSLRVTTRTHIHTDTHTNFFLYSLASK